MAVIQRNFSIVKELFSYLPSQQSRLSNCADLKNLQGLKVDIVELVSKKDLLQRPAENIFNSLKKALSSKPIGQGAEAAVYKIPDTPYILRVPISQSYDISLPLNTNISAQDKFNRYVARIGGNVEIGNYIQGRAAHIKEPNPHVKQKLQHVLNENVVDFPVEEYTALMNKIAEAPKLGMSFDSDGNNVIVDLVKKKFIPIDFNYSYEKGSKINILCDIQNAFNIEDIEHQKMFAKKLLLGFEKFLDPKNNIAIDIQAISPNILPFRTEFSGLESEKFKRAYLYAQTALNEAYNARLNYSNTFWGGPREFNSAIKQLREVANNLFT